MRSSLYKYFVVIVTACVIVYFAITFLFCLPDNYLPQSLIATKAKFQLIFYQKWGFFKYAAPHNDRLYYIIQNKQTGKEMVTVEVLEKLRKQKTAKAPFNQREVTTDIILSRCIAELLAIEQSQMDTRGVEVLQTLKSYAYIITQENDINIVNATFKIKITQKYFNDFENRKMPNPEKEVTVFESSYNYF